MDERDLRRKLRQFNADDLLDDGIENGSDLKVPLRSDDDGAGQPHAPASAPGGRNARQIRRRAARLARSESDRVPVSYAGLALGAGFVVAGILIFPFARDINVFHAAIRYRPSWIEHVTANESRAYALTAIVFGIAICAYSLYRPRH